jgi:hypothetical protein
MMNRLSRRVSKADSTSSSLLSDNATTSSAGSWSEANVARHGPVVGDAYTLFGKTEYLVLTERHLVKFANATAANAAFDRVLFSPVQAPPSPVVGRRNSRTPSTMSPPSPDGRGSLLTEFIPLEQIVALYKEEGTSPRFGIEVWWFEGGPAVSCSNAQFFFEHPRERDDWMADIGHVGRIRARAWPANALVPRNVAARIQQHVATVELNTADWVLDIFPVVQRAPPRTPANMTTTAAASASDQAKKQRDGSSYYLVMGEFLCYLVRVSKAGIAWKPQDLVLRVLTYGLVSLVRFRATINPRDERFVVSFR